jgi:flagellar biosynthesis component FlhA
MQLETRAPGYWLVHIVVLTDTSLSMWLVSIMLVPPGKTLTYKSLRLTITLLYHYQKKKKKKKKQQEEGRKKERREGRKEEWKAQKEKNIIELSTCRTELSICVPYLN